jgi:hypothetical protein
MSHHLDSPLARADVRLDITDLYVFAGQSGTVFVMNVCSSIAGDIPTPAFTLKRSTSSGSTSTTTLWRTSR